MPCLGTGMAPGSPASCPRRSHRDGCGSDSAWPPASPCGCSQSQLNASSSWQHCSPFPAAAFPAPRSMGKRLAKGWILPEGSGPHHLVLLAQCCAVPLQWAAYLPHPPWVFGGPCWPVWQQWQQVSLVSSSSRQWLPPLLCAQAAALCSLPSPVCGAMEDHPPRVPTRGALADPVANIRLEAAFKAQVLPLDGCRSLEDGDLVLQLLSLLHGMHCPLSPEC